MASIFKRSDSKSWYIKYYVNGQQVYQSLETTSERVARQRKSQIEAEEVKGELMAPSKTMISSFLENFCQFLSTVRTRKSYSGDISLLRIFFGPICPSLRLEAPVD